MDCSYLEILKEVVSGKAYPYDFNAFGIEMNHCFHSYFQPVTHCMTFQLAKSQVTNGVKLIIITANFTRIELSSYGVFYTPGMD